MKYVLMSIGVFISSIAIAAPGFDEVHTWLYAEWYTSFSDSNEFRPLDSITRGETAKFVNQFATAAEITKNYDQCTFSDIDGYDSTLLPHIYEACKYGILKGGNGKFMPNSSLTEAQALAMTIRLVAGMQDETWTPRYSQYYSIGKELGIITNESLESLETTSITRAKLGTRLYMAANAKIEIVDMPPEEEANTEPMIQGYVPYSEEGLAAALNAGQQVVLFFNASRCPLCNTLDEDILDNSDAIPDDTVIFSVDYDTSASLKQQYGVTSQHTLIYLDAAGNVADKTVKEQFTLASVLEAL